MLRLLLVPVGALWLAAAWGILKIVNAQILLVGGGPSYAALVLGAAIEIQHALAAIAASIGLLAGVCVIPRFSAFPWLRTSALAFSVATFALYLPVVAPPLGQIVTFVSLRVFPFELRWVPVAIIALGASTALLVRGLTQPAKEAT